MGSLLIVFISNNNLQFLILSPNVSPLFPFAKTPHRFSQLSEEALAQINSKDYAIPYSADHRKVVKIGVEFSQTEKGVKRWVIE
jgi:hypothetical protein